MFRQILEADSDLSYFTIQHHDGLLRAESNKPNTLIARNMMLVSDESYVLLLIKRVEQNTTKNLKNYEYLCKLKIINLWIKFV